MSGPQIIARGKARLVARGVLVRRDRSRYMQVPPQLRFREVEGGIVDDPRALQDFVEELTEQEALDALRNLLSKRTLVIHLMDAIARTMVDHPTGSADVRLVLHSVRRRHYGPGGHRRVRCPAPARDVAWMGAVIDWTHVRAPFDVIADGKTTEIPGAGTSAHTCRGRHQAIHVRLPPGHTVTAEGHWAGLIVRPK